MLLAVGAFDTPLLLTPGHHGGRGREPDLACSCCCCCMFYTVESLRARARDRVRADALRHADPHRGAPVRQGARQQRWSARGAARRTACRDDRARWSSTRCRSRSARYLLDVGPAPDSRPSSRGPRSSPRSTPRSETATRRLRAVALAALDLHRLPGADRRDQLGGQLAAVARRCAGAISASSRPIALALILQPRHGRWVSPVLFIVLAVRLFRPPRRRRGAHDAPSGATRGCVRERARPRALGADASRSPGDHARTRRSSQGHRGRRREEGEQGLLGQESRRPGSTRRFPTSRASTSRSKLDPAKHWLSSEGAFTLVNRLDAPLARIPLTGGCHWKHLDVDDERRVRSSRATTRASTSSRLPTPLRQGRQRRDRLEVGRTLPGRRHQERRQHRRSSSCPPASC